MAIVTHPQLLTANRLSDGEIVWWAQGGWVEMLAEGQVFAGADEAEAALQAAKAFVEKNIVVNPYLFEVTVKDGIIHPVKEREIIRAAGPTVQRHLGKQARHVSV
jgi:hypothetical protein